MQLESDERTVNGLRLSAGYSRRQSAKGPDVDASFAYVPPQRNTKKEDKQIKAGEISPIFQGNPHQARKSDTYAGWAKKNQETHFGYKNYILVDN